MQPDEMKQKLARRLIVLVAATAACLPAADASYDVIDLGTLGGSASVSLKINNRGQVVGGSTTNGDMIFHAFVTRPGGPAGAVQDLGTLFGGTNSQAFAINARGDIAAATVIDGQITAVLYTGTVKPIGTLGGRSSVPRGLNNRGEVVGYSALAGNGTVHAFLLINGDLLDLGTLGGSNSAASSINNRGDVVGSAETSVPGVTQAFLYRGGGLENLGTLGGKNSSAVAMNENGTVVGSADKADGTTGAFLFAGGTMRDLGTLGGSNSDAFDINDDGDIVGRSQFNPGDSATHAFFLGRCQMADLNSLIPADSGWDLREARGINNNGEIVGFGLYKGQTHSFLLLPNKKNQGQDCSVTGQQQGGGK